MTTRHESAKCQKVSDGNQSTLYIDRLSALPDDIICRILDFLPSMKYVVATSCLSKRWRSMWMHVTHLDLGTEIHQNNTKFSDIVNRVLLLHKLQTIRTFCLCQEGSSDSSEFELVSWITAAVERNVQSIDLDFDPENFFTLPRCLFTSKTLVVMQLYNCEGIPASGTVHLPSLKKLLLHSIEYKVDEALPHFLSGCPVLEELVINGTEDEDLSCCNISSRSVKRLRFKFPMYSSEFHNPDYKVIVNAPALRYLEVFDCSYEHLSLSSSSITSLIEADIWLNNYAAEGDKYYYTRCVRKFLNTICNVKVLKLNGLVEDFPDFGVAASYVRFNSLVRLELTTDWRILPKCFGSADKLEVLVIHEGYRYLKNWTMPMELRSAHLLFPLRTVTIFQFRCTDEELNVVGCILRNARVLERIEIHYQSNVISPAAKSGAFMRISSLPRASMDCEIVYSNYLGDPWPDRVLTLSKS